MLHFGERLNIILVLVGGNLNEPIFKSSNVQGVAWEGWMWKLYIDQCINP